jgi:transcription-repair coupling factor (superfamily II helicase)
MNSNEFLEKYLCHPAIIAINKALYDGNGQNLHIGGLCGSSYSLVFAALYKLGQAFVIVVNDREEAAYLYDDLGLFLPNENVLFFPSSFKRLTKYGQLSQENIVQRTEVLNKLNRNENYVVVTYPDALVEKVVPLETLVKNTLQVSVNEKISIDFVNEVLYEYGFDRVDFVYEPGQFSVRGSIIDVFSFAHDEPFRVDFFGNEVESIRSFDIATQLSVKRFDSISIIPNIQTGLGGDERIGLTSFLPNKYKLAFNNLSYTIDQVELSFHELQSFQDEELTIEANMLCNGQQLKKDISSRSCITFSSNHQTVFNNKFEFNTAPQPVFNKNFKLLANDLKENIANGYQNFILSNNDKQIERLKAIFSDSELNVKFTPVAFALHQGYIDRDQKMAIYTDHQIFERYHRYKLQSSSEGKESITLKELNKLQQGDYVVHIDHGIGKFAGLVKTDVNGKTQEAIRLVYKDNDSLLVNIHSLHRISKYKGKDGTEPNLNKLGTGAWQKMKSRAKSKVKDIAKELIALYAERLKEKGFAFSHDSYLQQELEASFMYEDTPDQYKATQAVKSDMEKLMPMDRLVCGDVGFGKTEVAIRAAFKAVADNKQVAILVPTTILAFQHHKTFSERLKDFPAKIGYISRLRKSADIKETIDQLKTGQIDIVIGTHKLVGKDVVFKDLGLLIIDEEQKFGVSVKEKLKKLKVNVDTLTLTATPIPRTLQFSLMGARDLSVIQTAPPNRYPIVTELHGFNEAIIRDAINYEIDRGGQVFFVHNRVQNIYDVSELIKKICPKARVTVGHGQMDGTVLENTMLDFIEGKYDVLIATTIIESGLDIPNANTIIINNAQNFGLSDLHQLRGRVGRSNKKAFCYLLSPPLSSLTGEARRRLKAIEEFSELGSGFNIAMRDLDIRGAGNLLGAEQSGFIADIGYETYHRILNEAVQELKQEDFKEVFEQRDKDEAAKAFMQLNFLNDCIIETDLEMRFPETYINSTSERMSLYRELDNIETEEELLTFEKSLTDRFGPLPEQALDLTAVVRLRRIAITLGMERIVLKNGKMTCFFVANQSSPFYQSAVFTTVLGWIQSNHRRCKMAENKNKLSLTFDSVKKLNYAIEMLSSITKTLPAS